MPVATGESNPLIHTPLSASGGYVAGMPITATRRPARLSKRQTEGCCL